MTNNLYMLLVVVKFSSLIARNVFIITYFSRYASCIGDDQSHCQKKSNSSFSTEFLGLNLGPREARIGLYVEFALLLLLAVIILVIGAVLCCRKS